MPNIESNLYFQTHLTSRAFQILQLAIDFINVATDVVVVNIVVVDWRRFDKLIEKKFFLISFDLAKFWLTKTALATSNKQKTKILRLMVLFFQQFKFNKTINKSFASFYSNLKTSRINDGITRSLV